MSDSLAAEVSARRGRGLGAFAQLSAVWRNRHLGLGAKVQVFNTFVVPHFVYGAEAWNVTQYQQQRLESAYNSCLRGIMGVRVSDRHSLQHIWETCQVKPLACLLAQRRLRWLGHVARMPAARYPHVALTARLTGATFGPGRPPQSFRSTVCKDLQAAGIPHEGGEWYVQAGNKPLGRQLVQGMPPTQAPPAPVRIQPARACRR